MMDETLTKMPAESVAMLLPPLGRWCGGSVYRYDKDTLVWRKVAEVPEDALLPAQKLMLERTRQHEASKEEAVNTLNIEVTYQGEPVYSGDWHGAPDPVRFYIASAEQHHGPENLEGYMRRKQTPIALAMQGYSLQVL